MKEYGRMVLGSKQKRSRFGAEGRRRSVCVVLSLLLLFQLAFSTTVYAKSDSKIMVVGGARHSLALKRDGTVWAWGDGHNGQLGTGNDRNSVTPSLIAGLTDVTGIAAGEWHSLALQKDGTLWEWGRDLKNEDGEEKPIQVEGLTDVLSMAAGNGFSLVLKKDGTVWSWGNLEFERAADTSRKAVVRPNPDQVPNLDKVTAIAAAGNGCMALKEDGSVWYWGDSLVGEMQASELPIQCDIQDAKAIAAGEAHILVLKDDGTVWAFGQNKNGELGSGSQANTSTKPVQVKGLTHVAAIATRGHHSLAQKADGTVWTWGLNESGQLGNGKNASSNVPVQVPELTNTVVAFGAGGYHSMAVKEDGSVWCWGANKVDKDSDILGALGDNTTQDRNKPVRVKHADESFNLYYDKDYFSDVKREAWYFGASQYMGETGIMEGTGAKMFSPDENMTRAMVAMVLYKMEKRPEITENQDYSDVPEDEWYSDAISWAKETEVMSGYGKGKFGPEDNIKREQFATVMHNFAAYKKLDTTGTANLNGYTDAKDIADWAEKAMVWAVGNGLINGVSDSKLDPGGEATRAQCASILMKLMGRMENVEPK